MEENIKDFLCYGISQEIPKKQIISMDILSIMLLTGGCVIESRFLVINIIMVFITVCNIILTFNRATVKGEKIFWLYGIWSTFLSIFFAMLGTKIAFSVLKREYFGIYAICIVVVYMFIAAMYIGIIIYLIKGNSYRILKKTNARFAFLFSGVSGILMAKILLSGMNYKNILQMASILCYLLSMLAMLGSFNLIKFFGIKYWFHNNFSESQ